MKDSGIEWIGEVPEHWETVRFRNFFKFNRGLSITKENLRDEGIPCVSYGEVHSEFGFEVNPKKHKLMCVSNDYLAKNKNSLIRKGDVVYADTSEDIEGSGNFTQLVTNDIVFAGYHTIICKPLKSINFRYLAYCLDSISYRNQIRKQVKGVKVYSITQSILKNTYIWLPSDREQEEITHYLDQMRSQIKLAIETEERQIKKLQEYKFSLINSAVTGKIKITPDMIAAEE
nr:restriction endonuclease subunit S [Paenalcaligenes hominis]